MLELLECRLVLNGLSLVGQWNGDRNYADLWAQGNFVYLGHLNEGGVDIINIANPANPVLASTFMGTGDNVIWDTDVQNNIGFFASNDLYNGGVYVVDVSNPYQPVQLAFITTAQGGLPQIHGIGVQGNYLYECNNTAKVAVFDISNPDQPQFVRYLTSPAPSPKVHEVTPIGNYLYATLHTTVGYTDIWDISDVGDTSKPVPLVSETVTGQNSHTAWPSPDGSYLAVSHESPGGTVSLYNIQNPASPYLVSTIPGLPLDQAYSTQRVQIAGNLVVASWYQAGPQIWDISDPSAPAFVGSYDTYGGGTSGTQLEQGNWGVYAFLGPNEILASDISNGLFILSIPTISISGTVFRDTNGSGVEAGGDPGLAGRTVFLDTNANGVLDPGEISTTTDANGNYSFTNLPAGAYRVREVTPAGWTQTTASPPSLSCANGTNITAANFGQFKKVTVSGNVFNDLNGNGTRDPGENGLAGWTAFVDLNNSGVFASGDPTALTNSQGNFTIPGVINGTHAIRLVSQQGWVETNSVPFIQPNSGSNVSGLSVGEQAAVLSGRAYLDVYGIGQSQKGDPGLWGWTVFVDLNNSGTLAPGDPTAQTDGYGNYGFTGLGPGTYVVREVVPAGWEQTTASPAPALLSAGGAVTGLDFGDYQFGTISGQVLNNSYVGNGVNPPPPPGMSGVTVFLDQNGDNLLDRFQKQASSSSGPKSVPDNGTVSSNIAVLSGAGPIAQVTVTLNILETADGDLTITLVSPWGAQIPLVNQRGGGGQNFTSTVLDDTAGLSIAAGSAPFSGRFKPEQPLAALDGLSAYGVWTLVVTDGASDGSSGTLVNWSLNFSCNKPTATTDANGNFTFNGLSGGVYVVREVVPAGWYQTAAPISTVKFSKSGTAISGLTFGNFQTVSISGTVFQDTNDSGALASGDPGIPGRTVYLDLNNDGVLDTSTVTLGSTDTPLPISAASRARSSILAAGFGGALTHISVTLNIAESNDQALALTLVSPWGKQFVLVNHDGGTGQDFTGTVLDDNAAIPIANGSAPFTGTFQPDQPLAGLDGNNPNGIWTLLVNGLAGSSPGTLLSWSLSMTTMDPSAVTDANGNYTITSVPGGKITVRQMAVPGWMTTTPYHVPIIPSNGTSVTGVTFGSLQFGSASGSAFLDVNGNGTRDPGDSLLSGWTVFLDQNQNGVLGPGITTLTSADTPVPIPDSPGFITPGVGAPGTVIPESLIHAVGVAGVLTHVSVVLNISHPYDSDLVIYLISPWGKSVLLVNRVGPQHQNFTGTILDDSASVPIAQGTPPYTGSYRPQAPLSVLNGFSPDGFWQLLVEDVSPGSAGTLLNWSIVFTTTEPTATTNAKGGYAFGGLSYGSYSIHLAPPANWIQTTTSIATVTGGGQVRGLGVGAFQLATAQGTVFNDLTDSGQQSGSDPGLAGWTLFADLNNDGLFGPVATPFVSEDTPQNIPDVGGVASHILVNGLLGALTHVSVTLNINHTFDRDLVITLVSPWGAQINLVYREGGNGHNFTGTILDDSAAQPISAGLAPFSGSYQPEQPLASLNGFNPNGVWTLLVNDVALNDVGTLLSWTLTLSVPEPSAVTDSNGNFVLAGLPQGSYSIRVAPPPGWVQTTINPPPLSVSVSGTTVSGLSFGFFQNANGPSDALVSRRILRPPMATAARNDIDQLFASLGTMPSTSEDSRHLGWWVS
jgi:subtilisin-like proprotein convertase family protein